MCFHPVSLPHLSHQPFYIFTRNTEDCRGWFSTSSSAPAASYSLYLHFLNTSAAEYSGVCACARVRVCMCACVCMWAQEVNLGCCSSNGLHLTLFVLKIDLFCLPVLPAYLPVCVWYREGQMSASDPLTLKLQSLVSCHARATN